MTMRILIILSLSFIVALGPGCVEPIPPTPRTVAEFTKIQRTHPQQYPKSTVMAHNIQRVLDPDLPPTDREASLDLIASLVGPGGELPSEMSAVLEQENCPPGLRQRIEGKGVAIASTKGNPSTVSSPPASPKKTTSNSGVITPLPLAELAKAPPGPRRRATLRWLIEHPKPAVLADLCKLWAAQSPSGSDEQLFRMAVANSGTGRWYDVLLDALNSKGFGARGSALVVLSGRESEIRLLDLVKRMTPRTTSVQAMKAFADGFGYVPRNGGQLLACVIIRSAHAGAIEPAGRLSRQWTAKYNYKFNIRDFHLLSRLAADPLRNRVERNELIKRLVTKLPRRKHVDPRFATFAKQAASLSVADLWNITLLDEMLQRPRVTLALKILASRVRQGLGSPRSGLVFYEAGKAAAKLYPQAADSRSGDREHFPERELQRAGFSALCHLHTRFETVYNKGERAVASDRELTAARQANFYGLVLTSIDSGTFSAFYYNPDGKVVSLGLFAFGK